VGHVECWIESNTFDLLTEILYLLEGQDPVRVNILEVIIKELRDQSPLDLINSVPGLELRGAWKGQCNLHEQAIYSSQEATKTLD
jgi:hypothetical protein